MVKDLFYEPLSHLTGHSRKFGHFDGLFKISRRIKRVINLVDSTTIQLFAHCMDWAKHRRRKAAAKCHMLLDARTFLPRFCYCEKYPISETLELQGDVKLMKK